MHPFALIPCVVLLAGHATPVSALYKGADVGWLSQMEAAGYAWYNSAGTKTDPFTLLQGAGIDSVRLRVFVNPSSGYCDGADTLYKAKRAAALGLNIMVDFHYSDTFADPGTQTVPAAWSGHTLAQLNTDVYQHTYGILQYLKNNGITVKWVQVGNEINSGMLWSVGKVTTSFANLKQLINSGYSAVKAIYPSALVVLHLSNGYDNTLFRWFFDGLKSAGASYDVIAMSHYPTASNYVTLNTQLNTNMKDMVSRYAKPVMVVEVGMAWEQGASSKAMIADVLNKVSALGSNGLGVFYWEPLCYPSYQGYQLGATNSSGKLTAAMDAF